MRRLLGVVLLVLVGVALTPGHAFAAGRPPIRMSVDRPVKIEQDAFPTDEGWTLVNLESNSPKDCRTTMATACDVYPLHVAQPPHPNLDYILDVTLRWDNPDEDVLDVAIFTEDKAADGYSYVSLAVGSAYAPSPARLRIINPEKSEYLLRVTNASGFNHGYSLDLSATLVPFAVPFDYSALPYDGRMQVSAPARATAPVVSKNSGVGFTSGQRLVLRAASEPVPATEDPSGFSPWWVVLTIAAFASVAVGVRGRRHVVRVRLFWKLLGPFLIIVLAGGMVAAFLTTRFLTERASDQLDQELLQRSATATAFLRDREAELVDAQRFAANLEGVPTAIASRDAGRVASAMASALAVNNQLDLVAAITPDANGLVELRRADGTVRESQGSSFTRSRAVADALRRVSEGAPEVVDVDGRPTLLVAGPVTNGDAVVGAMVVGEDLAGVVRRATERAKASVAFFAPDGKRLSASTGTYFAASTPASATESSLRVRDARGGERQATLYAPLTESGVRVGTVAVRLPSAPAFAAVSGTRTRLVLVALAVMAAVFALGALVSRSVLRRVGRLIDTNRALGAGDLAVRAPDLGEDELGELGAGFNLMAEQLEASYAEMERRVAERTEELQHLYQDVVRGNEARSELFASISHEFRTPLFAILAHAELMGDKELRPRGTVWLGEFADTITESAQILLRRVNDILELAQLDSTGFDLEVSPFALGGLVDRVAPQVAALARQSGLRLVIEVPNDLPLVDGDERRVEQILLNVLSNAIKYNRPDGSVTLTASAADDGVEIRVHDTGVGIPPDSAARVFEPFYRVEGSKDDHASSGLGLALAKRLTEAQSGSIRFTSEVGVGTTFFIHLPTA